MLLPGDFVVGPPDFVVDGSAVVVTGDDVCGLTQAHLSSGSLS
jgi:hypothetical protein